MKKQFLIGIMVSLIASSCSQKTDIKRELSEFYSSSIDLSMDSLSKYSYNYSDSLPFDMNQKTLVVYHDSLTCGICETKNLGSWNSLLSSIDSVGCYTPFNVLFVFTPRHNQAVAFRVMLKNIDIHYPVIIDENAIFANSNKLPLNTMLHTFLLDEEGKVELVGDILRNNSVRNLFLDKIRIIE